MVLGSAALAQSGKTVAATNALSDTNAKVIPLTQKKTSVKLYPNPSYGKISVSTTNNGTFHFYIFDLEGTMVYQAILTKKERKNIENLAKGTYIYDVFEKDQSIEEGRIIIK